MPALLPTKFTGQVTWLGLNPDREAGLSNDPVTQLSATFAGPEGESRAGLTRLSCGRVTRQYPRGTTIRNTRQFSLISEEELTKIAQNMGLPTLHPSLIGTTLLISGIPDFSLIPPSSRLQFASGATLCVDMENRPCHLPVKEIKAQHPKQAAGFKAAAKNLRGVTAWVEREGRISMGDSVTLHIPDQPAWPHL